MIFSLVIVSMITALILFLTRARTIGKDTIKVKSNSNLTTKKRMSKDFHYLNYSSTNMPHSGVLNPSDLAYPSVINDRKMMLSLNNKLKKYVNAPPNAKVIINSGATESIANMVFWAKSYMPDGQILGSSYDHQSVELNCLNQNYAYNNALEKAVIPTNTALIMLTHVDSKTGSILNIPNYINNVFNRYTFQHNSTNDDDKNKFTAHGIEDKEFINKHTLTYRPIIALDCSQSIGKVPIDMQRWKVNALFFSLHKLGGEQGIGVLIIDDDNKQIDEFKPLIAGAQQHMLRGGTYNMKGYIDSCMTFFDLHSSMSSDKHPFSGGGLAVDSIKPVIARKETWEKYWNVLEKGNMKLVKPQKNHLYNTFLIESPTCPLAIINYLASKGIYVGNISACENENINIKNKPKLAGDTGKKYIRISFNKASDLNDKVIDEIIIAMGLAEKAMLDV